ncbi:hypothetical protein ABIB25_005403 [Nakamurella sp. UYEF19]|uniref:hypothetical protein n=1 Tax=Nakamurella sp. UYEF19 TaxID=1756392 RepID=UPI003395C5D0
MTRPAQTVGSLGAGLLAGLVGTTFMTATLWAERRLRRNLTRPVDYDASSHVVTAAATVLHWSPATDRQRRGLFLLVHWGYGSATGMLFPVLRRATGNPRVAAIVFYLSCQTMAMVLFSTAGKTPPPWRWRTDTLASSLAQHAVYAVTVAATQNRLDPAGRS